nr:fatty acyl-CoA reductase 3-like [Ipomoea trifida]
MPAVLLEKILRTQPNIKKIFLLIRAKDSESARQRFNNEVLEIELFRVVKEKVGGSLSLSALAEEKVFPVPGDISSDDELGIVNSHLKDQVLREVDIIINSAATTTFDERYDVAMRINALGAMNLLNFAKKCLKVKMFVHVSTAYVCGEGTGIVAERAYHLGETLNGNSYLDIDEEKKMIEEKLMELEAQNASEKEVKLAMKDLGIQRASMHGWPNTYSFTKAMGEMLLLAFKEDLHLIILRPTIITSTYKEPFPGWIEGAKTIDIFVLMYGKGKSNFMLGDPNSILDVIPVDMVVNAMVAAVVHHANHESCQEFIYHVGSSSTNPLKLVDIQNLLFRYFTDNPWTTNTGNLVKVHKYLLLTSMPSLRRYIAIYHLPLLHVLKLMNVVLFHYLDEKCMTAEKNINFVMRIAELYKPYLFFYGIFDDTNTKRLRMATEQINMMETLNFDPNCIQWEDYFMNTHFPGVVKYTF